MILNLVHKKLDIFKISKQVVIAIYKLTLKFSMEEKICDNFSNLKGYNFDAFKYCRR